MIRRVKLLRFVERVLQTDRRGDGELGLSWPGWRRASAKQQFASRQKNYSRDEKQDQARAQAEHVRNPPETWSAERRVISSVCIYELTRLWALGQYLE